MNSTGLIVLVCVIVVVATGIILDTFVLDDRDDGCTM